ncbi:calcium-translocating P-type ATPase [Artomyces pyxidatus]|uniref:Calcium-translocating P-type ATPase n=1 Tax=Artomyces pyxidatus TaxID=48021 RepID=A0ACB8TFQ2_9AGAM|nr:calcium-translocating P-type ATPase [Artomyces pyxidatus]
MASNSLDIPQIAVTGSTDDLQPSSPISPVSPDSLRQPHSPLSSRARSPSDPGFLALPTPILKTARTSLESPISPAPSSTFSDTSSYQPPPSPTLSAHSGGSVRFANTTSLRDNNPDDHDPMSSLQLLSPPAHARGHHRRKSSNATVSSLNSGSETEADHHLSNVGLSPMNSVRSDGASTLASPTHTHVDSASEQSRPTSRTSFIKKLHRLGRASRSPDDDEGNETDADSDKGKSKEPELARPAQFNLEQEAAFDPAPFAFKPFQLANLVDPKSLETLEALGGVQGLLRGLGTHRTLGLSSKGPTPSAHGSPSVGLDVKQSDFLADESVERPNIMITTPSGEAEGLRSMTSLGSNSADHRSPRITDDAFGATLEDRQRVYGHNVLPSRSSKSLLSLMWTALKDKVLVLLSIAAVVSLALGFFQDFGTTRPAGEPPVDWVEGVAIIIAIAIVVMVGSLNDWQKERQFKVLNEKKEERQVKVMRDGVEHLIDVQDVVVGDIALLEPGEVVPCDGVFLSGHNVRCDESGATGESDAIKKLSYEGCIALRNKKLAEYSPDASSADLEGQEGDAGGDQRHTHPSGMDLLGHTDCFIVSGSKVLEGVGSYVVISVGTKSFNGRIMMALRRDSENTPLQLKLNDLAELIAKFGSIAGLLLFSALMIRFFVQLGQGSPPRTPSQNGIAFTQILIIAVTLVVVAVPEGLPLAVTLALAFATKRMTREKLLVRVLGSCETMANASVICTDKTGTLTQNEMTVVAGSVGIHAKFVRQFDENQTRSNVDEERERSERKHTLDFSLDLTKLDRTLTPQLRELFNSAIAVNSTAFEDRDETGTTVFIGSKTETALLKFAKELGWANYKETRDSAEIVQMIPFSSERKAMGVVVTLPGGRKRLYLKGASEILTEKCTRHVVVYQDAAAEGRGNGEVETADISELDRDNISRTITFYASQTLRTIALCYRDFEEWPPLKARLTDANEVEFDDLATDLSLIGITGIEDPLREGVREAVANCVKAGVQVKMCTGDNVLTARSIAQQCGIYTAGGIVMEGPVFRQLPPRVMKSIVPRLQVLARSSPEDKRILVEALKELGDIVGVTGDGTNDGPALKTAHVGFSMGIAGTEVAKEASDIILMDDNFSSIVKAIMWGRCVNDAVRKFLQFQISTNVTAVVITFVTAIASDQESSVLSAVQLLWINIIMDTFAALALATDPASPALLDRKPDKKTDPLFTVDMIKQILGQSTYQIVIVLIFHFLGSRILGYHPTSDSTLQQHQDRIVQTLVFNAFVFAQIFNSVNSRRLDKKYNIFEGMLQNWYFMTITFIEVAVQVLIVFVGSSAFQVTRIGGREWGISLALGVVSIPLGALIRWVPNAPCERFFRAARLLPNPEVLPTKRANAEPGLNFAMDRVRDNLSAFSTIRGGRVRSSSFVIKSRTGRPDTEIRLVPSLMAMVPTLMASNIVGSNWAPQFNGSLSDPARFDPSKSSAELWENKPLPDERPRQSVANLIGRFEQQQTKRQSLPASSSSTTGSTGSRPTSVVSNVTGDSAKEEIKVAREWPPVKVDSSPKPESPSPPTVSVLRRSTISPQAVVEPMSPPTTPPPPEDPAPPTPKSAVTPTAPTPVASRTQAVRTHATGPRQSAPPKVGGANRPPPTSPKAAASRTTASTTTVKPATAHPPSAPKTPSKPTASARPAPATLPRTVKSPAPQPTPRARPKTPSSHHTPPSRPKTPSSHPPPARPKTPSARPTSGLFAPTAASLAKSRNAPPVPAVSTSGVKKVPDLSRLSKPTAASASKARTPVVVPPARGRGAPVRKGTGGVARGAAPAKVRASVEKAVPTAAGGGESDVLSDPEHEDEHMENELSTQTHEEALHDEPTHEEDIHDEPAHEEHGDEVHADAEPELESTHEHSVENLEDLPTGEAPPTEEHSEAIQAPSDSLEIEVAVSEDLAAPVVVDSVDPQAEAPTSQSTEERLDEVKPRHSHDELEHIVNMLEGPSISQVHGIVAEIPDEE